MKRALVTGGCGFIGSNLSHELVKRGWTVDIVDDMSSGHLELLDGLKIRVIPIDFLGLFYEKICIFVFNCCHFNHWAEILGILSHQ